MTEKSYWFNTDNTIWWYSWKKSLWLYSLWGYFLWHYYSHPISLLFWHQSFTNIFASIPMVLPVNRWYGKSSKITTLTWSRDILEQTTLFFYATSPRIDSTFYLSSSTLVWIFYNFRERLREDEGADKDRCPFHDGNFAFAKVCGTCWASSLNPGFYTHYF